jgi:hypothetical protein
MKGKQFIAPLVFSLLSSSCTLYLKDAIHGRPYQRTYEDTYENARAEGLSHEEADRQAMLASGRYHRQEWGRRKAERKKERESSNSSRDWFDLKWD